VYFGASRYIPAHSGAFRCIPAHSGAFRRIPVHSGAFRYISVHSCAFRRIPVHSGASRFIPVHSGAFRIASSPLSRLQQCVFVMFLPQDRHFRVSDRASSCYFCRRIVTFMHLTGRLHAVFAAGSSLSRPKQGAARRSGS
jgi:uncharacterized glyoxalase superfamily metalloenzyme YdcJ